MRQEQENVSPQSNEGRNLYVIKHITNSLLELMEQRNINEITIGKLCNHAGVGRASFYRNFTSKEDVIVKELKRRLDKWWLGAIVKADFDFTTALFEHLYDESKLYLLLYQQGLSHLNLQSIKEACGPKANQDNIAAYQSAFFAYGLYGWIEEWFNRGMKETPEMMSKLIKQAANDQK